MQKIKSIEITKLYNIPENNYFIEFTPEKYINVVYSLNGMGKTTLFKLIDAILNRKMIVLDSILFESITINFERMSWVISRTIIKHFDEITLEELPYDDFGYPGDKNRPNFFGKRFYYPIVYKITSWGFNKQTIEYEKLYFGETTNNNLVKALEEDYENNKNLHFFIDSNTYKPLPLKDFNKYKLVLYPHTGTPEYLHSTLLYANRDYNRYAYDHRHKESKNDDLYASWWENYNDYDTLTIELKEAKRIIQESIEKKQIQKSIDEEREYITFPLTDKILFLEEKIKEIWDKNSYQLEDLTPEDYDYYMEQDWRISQRINKAMHQLEEIINNKSGFIGKKIYYENGIKIKLTSTGEELPLTALSSGEKNLLLLYFEILFTSDDRLLLIDEPEVSLHAEWCSQIIDNILPICKEKDLQVIIATHSPDFIAKDHFDMVSMFEKKMEAK